MSPNKLVFTFGVSYVFANFGENRSSNATVRVPTNGNAKVSRIVSIISRNDNILVGNFYSEAWSGFTILRFAPPPPRRPPTNCKTHDTCGFKVLHVTADPRADSAIPTTRFIHQTSWLPVVSRRPRHGSNATATLAHCAAGRTEAACGNPSLSAPDQRKWMAADAPEWLLQSAAPRFKCMPTGFCFTFGLVQVRNLNWQTETKTHGTA